MSVTFFIQNPQATVLNVGECLDLLPNLEQNSVDEYADDFDADTFAQSPLDEYDYLLMYGEDYGRGFELGYADGQYNVRVNTPSSIGDWQTALAFLQMLAKRLNQPVINEYDDVFTAETISDFDFMADIESGVRALQEIVADDEYKNCELFGIFHPMAFNKKMVDTIFASQNPAQTFSQMLTENQQTDAYFARQILIQDKETQEISGLYVLSENLPTILPYKPAVEYGVEVKNEDVKHWQIQLYPQDDWDKKMAYADFITQLEPHEYHWLDASYILVYAMNQQRFNKFTI